MGVNKGEGTEALTQTLWSYGCNDHLDKLPALPADVKVSGLFRIDFLAACEKYGVVPHPGFSPPREGNPKGQRKSTKQTDGESRLDSPEQEPTEGPILAIQTMLVDRASMQVMNKLLMTSNRLEVLRFSSCRLDAEMLALLREGLKDLCTVSALQIEWNPVEIPVDAAAVAKAEADGNAEEVAELEKKRQQQQASRTLQSFGESMQAQQGDIDEAIKAVVNALCEDDPEREAALSQDGLDLGAWLTGFHQAMHFPAEYVQQIFALLDGPTFGGDGTGCIPLSRLSDVLMEVFVCPGPVSEEALGDKRKSVAKPAAAVALEEVKDPVGDIFATFVDSTSILELVSFRCCELTRLEAVVMARAMRGNLPTVPANPHLRALNLWGNRICDQGAAAFGDALECHFGLQYLGLGCNLITHVGLQKLCRPLGYSRISDKSEADAINKEIKEKAKERDKRAKAPPLPKKDARGRERHMAEFYMPSLEDRKEETGEVFWLHGRNMVLKTLNLEHNPVSDVATVLRVQAYGVGDLVLRKTKCAQELLELKAKAEAEGDPNAWLQSVTGGLPGEKQGWNLILQ